MRNALLIGALVVVAACSGPASGPVQADGTTSLIPDAARAAESRFRDARISPFEATVTLVDRYGVEGDAAALGFSWDAAELRRASADIDRYRLLDLADVSIRSPYGVMALADWCDAEGTTLTRRLCGEERRRAEDAWASRSAGSIEPQGPGSAR